MEDEKIYKMSCAGLYHLNAGEENQDAVQTGSNEKYNVISLADGVSSCAQAKAGAETASRAVTELLLEKGNHFLSFSNAQIADLTLGHILYELKEKAKNEMNDVEEYSSTIASVLVDKKHGRLLYINLGDGLILITRGGKCHVLAEPMDSALGCCVTTTKNAAKVMPTNIVDIGEADAVIICSDGAWPHMYSGCRLKPEVLSMLVNGEFDKLKAFFNEQDCNDDYSFVSMKLHPERRSA